MIFGSFLCATEKSTSPSSDFIRLTQYRQSDLSTSHRTYWWGEVNPVKLLVLLLSLAISRLGVVTPVPTHSHQSKRLQYPLQSINSIHRKSSPSTFSPQNQLHPSLCFNFSIYSINVLFTSTVQIGISVLDPKNRNHPSPVLNHFLLSSSSFSHADNACRQLNATIPTTFIHQSKIGFTSIH